MRLTEYEAKRLLADSGVAVPRGELYPRFPAPPSSERPIVAKAQLLEGGRGKRGGVLVCRSPEELEEAAVRLRRGSGSLPAAAQVLCEEMLVGERELYFAVAVDRDHGVPVLLVGREGGVEVELADPPERIELSILDDRLPDEVVRRAAGALEVNVERLGGVLAGMWSCFRGNECLLLEVNPCLLLGDGRLVALDAKAEIDDNAAERTVAAQLDGKTPFEAACAADGVTATELDGDVAIVTSGAGLGMATLDMLAQRGGAARCVVDLGYSALQEAELLGRVVQSVQALKPSALLVNAYLQMASCRVLATSVAAAVRDEAAGAPVVARLIGNDDDGVDALLDAAGVMLAVDLESACEAAVSLAGGR